MRLDGYFASKKYDFFAHFHSCFICSPFFTGMSGLGILLLFGKVLSSRTKQDVKRYELDRKKNRIKC